MLLDPTAWCQFPAAVDGWLNAPALAAQMPASLSLDNLTTLTLDLPLAAADWRESWMTPLWIIAAGIILGFVLLALVYGVFALLSFIPPLGRLADNRSHGLTVSVVLGLIAAAALMIRYIDWSTGEFQFVMVLPLLLLGMLFGFGIVYGVWRRTRAELWDIAREGVMPLVLGTGLSMVIVGGIGMMFLRDGRQILASVSQVPIWDDGVEVFDLTLEPASADLERADEAPFQKVDVQYDPIKVTEILIESDGNILIGDAPTTEELVRAPLRVGEDEAFRFDREAQQAQAPPLPGDSAALHIQNQRIEETHVRFTFTTSPAVPQAATVVYVALSVFLLISGMITFRQAAPRISAIANVTAKSEISSPLFLIFLAVGVSLVVVFAYTPFYSMGDDMQAFKDSCVTVLMMSGMFLAIWCAGSSVSQEIDGRTALTVLSKPVSRLEFLFGKYVGIMKVVFVLFLTVLCMLVIFTCWKSIHEARELMSEKPDWRQIHAELQTLVPMVTLYFLQTATIAALAVTLATRLPLLANMNICFVVFVLGNLTASFLQSDVGQNELVAFVGNLIAVVVPNLNSFNVQAAVDSSKDVPTLYVAGAFNYWLVFGGFVCLLGLVSFEDRDLA
ncbi:MAG: ABC transporter permease [Planctomycetota bacterium]